MDKIGMHIAKLIADAGVDVESLPPAPPLVCGALAAPYPGEALDPAAVYCDGFWHSVASGVAGRCPERRANEVRKRVAGERERLRAELGKLSTPGFDAWIPTRVKGGPRALEVMRRFALDSQAPAFNVLLKGTAGTGRTHLLLASHFGLLERGVSSEYVRTPELRRLFKQAENFDVEVATEARGKLERYVYAQVVHFDDAGHVEGDQRGRGQFAEGLKDLLDRTRARWAVSTNRTLAEAEQHPDLTGTIVSRMLLDCDVLELVGDDYRVETARSG